MTTPPSPALRIRDLVLPGQIGTARRTAPRPASFELLPGQTGALLGHTGAGKTYLARVLTGQALPESGTARVAGLTPSESAAAGRTVWFDEERARVHPAQRAAEVLSGARCDRFTRAHLLESLRLAGWEDCPAGELPGSLRQGLGLARALLPIFEENTALLVLDDLPGLDEHAARLADWLPDTLHASRCALLLTTRCPTTALLLADRSLVLRPGQPPAVWPAQPTGPGAEMPPEWRLRLAGQLDPARAGWFPGLRLSYTGPDSLLCGPLPDAAALYGLLARVRDLGLSIVSLEQASGSAEDILTAWMSGD